MTIELPVLSEGGGFTSEELRLELACALYARGRIGKIAGAELAGVDFFTFQQALGERQIPAYSDEMLAGDLATLNKLFPS
jgi:predicted HTH domain antitoxin